MTVYERCPWDGSEAPIGMPPNERGYVRCPKCGQEALRPRPMTTTEAAYAGGLVQTWMRWT